MQTLSKRLKHSNYIKSVPVSEEERDVALGIEREVRHLMSVLQEVYDKLQNISYRLEARQSYNRIVFGADADNITTDQAKAFVEFGHYVQEKAKEIDQFSQSISKKIIELGTNDKIKALADIILDKNINVQKDMEDLLEQIKDANRNDNFFSDFKTLITQFVNPNLDSFKNIILEKNLLSFLREDVRGLKSDGTN